MTGFDHDVLAVGSGFGGSVTALRLGSGRWSPSARCARVRPGALRLPIVSVS